MKVVEEFISINGEGKCAGQLAYFVRFAGCNLNCEYCDTKWANQSDVKYEECTPKEIADRIKESGINNVTLTGGEPLLQSEMNELLSLLSKEEKVRVEIETNGSVFVKDYIEHAVITLDYKTGCSAMTEHMNMENYSYLRPCDTVKFVVGSRSDLEMAADVIRDNRLVERGIGIYLSPCFGMIEPADMVEFLKVEKLNGVNIQLQLHKYIWDPNKKGV